MQTYIKEWHNTFFLSMSGLSSVIISVVESRKHARLLGGYKALCTECDLGLRAIAR